MSATQRGNILFLILLAVVLFAALAYAVTSSMRGGGKDASDEKMDLLAGQIIQNATMIENAIHRAMLIDNIPEYGFDFSGGVTSGLANASGPNATCVKDSCRIFTGEGESVKLPSLPASAAGVNTPNVMAYMLDIHNVGTPATDLALAYRYLSAPLCAALNRVLKSPVDATKSLEGWGWSDGNSGASRYNGTLTALPTGYATLGDQDPDIKGQQSFCFRHSSGDEYNFVHVLLAR